MIDQKEVSTFLRDLADRIDDGHLACVDVKYGQDSNGNVNHLTLSFDLSCQDLINGFALTHGRPYE